MSEVVDRDPSWRGRLGKAGRFLVIVWGLAGAFQGLDYAKSRLLQTAFDRGWIDPEWSTPSAPETAACAEALEGLQPAALDQAGFVESRRLAFDLGLNLGFEVGARNIQSADEEALRRMREERAATALELGVPMPEVPVFQSRANMFHEFFTHLVTDPQCISARISRTYSPQHDSLYRLGAVVAQIVLYRQIGYTEQAYPIATRQFARAAGVPEDHWAPLTRAADPSDADRVGQEALQILERLQSWISSPQ